jgi:hypothetical protein
MGMVGLSCCGRFTAFAPSDHNPEAQQKRQDAFIDQWLGNIQFDLPVEMPGSEYGNNIIQPVQLSPHSGNQVCASRLKFTAMGRPATVTMLDKIDKILRADAKAV